MLIRSQHTENSDGTSDRVKHALVVDDHPIVCAGVRELLQRAFPSIAVTVSSGGEGILQEICGTQWAFVILDINLPGHNGINILKHAKLRRPEIPIVIFSLFAEDHYAARALQAGAVAYVSKERSPRDLVGAVKMALQERANLSQSHGPASPVKPRSPSAQLVRQRHESKRNFTGTRHQRKNCEHV